MESFTGILIVILAGIFQGSFILPMTLVKQWKWENTWLVFSFAGMIVLNLLLAAIFIIELSQVYAAIPDRNLVLLALFGFGWGVGAVLFGIGMDKLGMALGYPIIWLCHCAGSYQFRNISRYGRKCSLGTILFHWVYSQPHLYGFSYA